MKEFYIDRKISSLPLLSSITRKSCKLLWISLSVNVLQWEAKLNFIVAELGKSLAYPQEKISKEEFEKLDAMDSFAKEKEARLIVEKSQASFLKDLGKIQEELQSDNQKALDNIKIQELLSLSSSSRLSLIRLRRPCLLLTVELA